HYLPPHGPYDPPTRFLDDLIAQGPADVGFLPPHARDVDVSLESAVFGRIPWYQAKVSFSTDPRHYITRYEANVRYADSLAGDLFRRRGGPGPHSPHPLLRPRGSRRMHGRARPLLRARSSPARLDPARAAHRVRHRRSEGAGRRGDGLARGLDGDLARL